MHKREGGRDETSDKKTNLRCGGVNRGELTWDVLLLTLSANLRGCGYESQTDLAPATRNKDDNSGLSAIRIYG